MTPVCNIPQRQCTNNIQRPSNCFCAGLRLARIPTDVNAVTLWLHSSHREGCSEWRFTAGPYSPRGIVHSQPSTRSNVRDQFCVFCASVFPDAGCVLLFYQRRVEMFEKYAYSFVTCQMRRLIVMAARICSWFEQLFNLAKRKNRLHPPLKFTYYIFTFCKYCPPQFRSRKYE